MDPRYIAAIEIGSSKIKGIVATVDQQAAINVLAVEETDAGGSVRYGRILNAREASSRVDDIIRRLENNPRLNGGRIASIFIAEGGRSLSSKHVEATVTQGGEAEITDTTLDRLRRQAVASPTPGRDTLAISHRHYFVDNAEVKKLIGVFGDAVRGEFTLISASSENRRALERVKFESHQQEINRKYIVRPIALADMLLSDSERQIGCLLIDFGAETTTLAVYREGTLQMTAVLPMGSSNITRDLCSGLSITEDVAENIKCTKGEAISDRVAINAITDADSREITNYVSARVGEIIANINATLAAYNIKPAELAAGIVLTGGGSRLRGFKDMLEARTKMHVRAASAPERIRTGAGNANIDVVALALYAADHFADSCLEFPVDTDEQTAEEHTQPAPTEAPVGSHIAGYVVDDANDDILEDDPDPDDLPAPAEDANITRQNLISRLKNFFAPPVTEEEDLDN
ncbi:MAG: cell division protein FtsA [Muribaculaceae bacterium]